MRHFILSVVVMLGSSCRGGEATRQDPDKVVPEAKQTEPDRPQPDATAKPDPCGAAALGLGKAVALAPWRPPEGCTPRCSGTSIARTDAELAARLECPPGVAAGVDLSQHAVLCVEHPLSPAGVGLAAFDDGALVTLASRQRRPCPDDPQPMPMNVTDWFLLPAGGERTFKETTCTVDSTCR